MNLYFTLQAPSGGLMGYLPLIIMFAIIYIFFILPTKKKNNEQKKFNEALAKGDEVVTSSGVIGQITRIGDKDVTIQTEGKTFVRMVKSAISKEMTDFYHQEDKKK